MTFDPAERITQFHDAINRLDYEAIENFFAENATGVSNGVGSLAGREAIMEAFRGYLIPHPAKPCRNSSETRCCCRSSSSSTVWYQKTED